MPLVWFPPNVAQGSVFLAGSMDVTVSDQGKRGQIYYSYLSDTWSWRIEPFGATK